MRGLPWQIRAEDVLRFFRGAKLARNGLLVCFDARGTGYAAFVSEEDRERALKKNRQHMGARCVRMMGVCAVHARRAGVGAGPLYLSEVLVLVVEGTGCTFVH
jgi:hypothetical protein